MKKAHIILTFLLVVTLGSAQSQTDFTVYSSGELNLMFEQHTFSGSDPLEPPTTRKLTYFRGGYQTGFLFKKPVKKRYAIRAGLGFGQVNYQSGRLGPFTPGELRLKEEIQEINGNIIAVRVGYKQVVLPIYLHRQLKESNHGLYVGASVVRSFGVQKVYHQPGIALPMFASPAMINRLIYFPVKETATSVVPEIGYSYTWQISTKHAMVIDPYIKQSLSVDWSDFRRMTTLGLRLAYKPSFTKA